MPEIIRALLIGTLSGAVTGWLVTRKLTAPKAFRSSVNVTGDEGQVAQFTQFFRDEFMRIVDNA